MACHGHPVFAVAGVERIGGGPERPLQPVDGLKHGFARAGAEAVLVDQQTGECAGLVNGRYFRAWWSRLNSPNVTPALIYRSLTSSHCETSGIRSLRLYR